MKKKSVYIYIHTFVYIYTLFCLSDKTFLDTLKLRPLKWGFPGSWKGPALEGEDSHSKCSHRCPCRMREVGRDFKENSVTPGAEIEWWGHQKLEPTRNWCSCKDFWDPFQHLDFCPVKLISGLQIYERVSLYCSKSMGSVKRQN